MITKYKNPWHKSNNPIYGPDWYSVNSWDKLREYEGCYLVEKTSQVDVVKELDGVLTCITQVGSVRYAKAFIDNGCVHGNYTPK